MHVEKVFNHSIYTGAQDESFTSTVQCTRSRTDYHSESAYARCVEMPMNIFVITTVSELRAVMAGMNRCVAYVYSASMAAFEQLSSESGFGVLAMTGVLDIDNTKKRVRSRM